MRHTLPALLLLSASCVTTVPSTELPLEAFELHATVWETRSGRLRVEVQLDRCGVALQRILLEDEDRLEATLGGRTIELTRGAFLVESGNYHGIFPRTTDPADSDGELRITLLRQSGSQATPGARVQVPAELRLLSPRHRQSISRVEDLEVRWTPLAGDPAPGADRALWAVAGTKCCGRSDHVPRFSDEVALDARAEGFVLEAGTLALPSPSGDGIYKSELTIRRINDGRVDAGFCPGSSIEAHRENSGVFLSTP